MIAAPRTVAAPRVERVRTATRVRARRTRRRLHAPVHAVVTLTLFVLVPLLTYVWLTSRLTSMNYALERAGRDRAALVAETQRLDERISQLTSQERLAQVAAQLHMRDPLVYAVVPVADPKPQPKPAGLPLFAWFSAR